LASVARRLLASKIGAPRAGRNATLNFDRAGSGFALKRGFGDGYGYSRRVDWIVLCSRLRASKKERKDGSDAKCFDGRPQSANEERRRLYAELSRSTGKADIGLSIASRFYRLSTKSYTAMLNSPIRGPACDAYDPSHNNAGGRS